MMLIVNHNILKTVHMFLSAFVGWLMQILPHLRLFCNNCIQYFLETKPWFTLSTFVPWFESLEIIQTGRANYIFEKDSFAVALRTFTVWLTSTFTKVSKRLTACASTLQHLQALYLFSNCFGFFAKQMTCMYSACRPSPTWTNKYS